MAKTRKSILECAPKGQKLRPVQEAFLLEVERVWDHANVIAGVLPTAAGKTLCAYTIAKYAAQAAMLTPSRLLVDQYLADYPGIPYLKAKDDYLCDECRALGADSCYEAARLRGSSKRPIYSGSCQYPMHIRRIRSVPYFLCNMHVMLAHKLSRPNIIVDEAHEVLSFIQDLSGLKLWSFKERIPTNVKTSLDLLEWIESQPSPSVLCQKAAAILRSPTPTHIVEKTYEEFGRADSEGTRRVESCWRFRPVDVRNESALLWHNRTSKIVLLSATINRQDLLDLGLSAERGYRTASISGASPIPAERRPIYYRPIANMSYANQDANIAKLAEAILKIEADHPDQSGVVHAPYSLLRKLREYLRSIGQDQEHYFWHDSDTRSSVYNAFLVAPQGSVLFASGLYTGIDLKENLARWQVLCKIPYPSLGDAAIKYKADTDPDWYRNQALKLVCQCAGRVCRTPTDYGETYIVDTAWERLRREAAHLIPGWFSEAFAYE